MRGLVLIGLVVVAGVAVGAGCGGTSTGGRQTDGFAGSSATASGGNGPSGVGGAASGGRTGDGGTGMGGGATGTGGTGAATVADLCPELVAADCAALSAYLPDEATCVAALPTLALLCGTVGDELVACTGPDPDITCDAAGVPTSTGCEAEWNAVMACVAQLMGGGAGG